MPGGDGDAWGRMELVRAHLGSKGPSHCWAWVEGQDDTAEETPSESDEEGAGSRHSDGPFLGYTQYHFWSEFPPSLAATVDFVDRSGRNWGPDRGHHKTLFKILAGGLDDDDDAAEETHDADTGGCYYSAGDGSHTCIPSFVPDLHTKFVLYAALGAALGSALVFFHG